MTTRFAVDIIKPLNTEAYRSGHNEAVLKTVWVKAHGGSNPSASANARHGNSRAFFTLRQREDEITYRYTSFRSPSLHSGRISASASYGWHPQVAKENGEKTTLRFFFVFLKDHPSQASAEGSRNNVTGLLHNPYSVATELLLTNPSASAKVRLATKSKTKAIKDKNV